MIKTIGELKRAITNIADDFTVSARIVRTLSEEELKGSRYPYPYEYYKANIEIGDIGYSDKDVFINVEEISDDVCECRKLKGDVFEIGKGFKFCPYCGKKIKVVE